MDYAMLSHRNGFQVDMKDRSPIKLQQNNFNYYTAIKCNSNLITRLVLLLIGVRMAVPTLTMCSNLNLQS